MKTAPDISPNPSAPASLLPADLRRILEEKDRLLAQQQALNAELRKHILLLEERKRPRIHTCFPHLTLCRLSPGISRHRRNRWTCLMPPKVR
ncbi:hypothetical protein, partial [Thiolapillus sp.]|uniref:hypothetical protein n=1 Tax=Thiolapillus sp. TaxID=2017437 RepID=UPI0025EF4AA8